MPSAEAAATFRKVTLWDPSDLGARGDWVVSIFQYAVVGFALMAALCCDRHRAYDVLAFLIVIPVCVGLAIGTEFLQIYFPPRTVSANDIILESAGGALGATAWIVVGRPVTRWLRRLNGVTSLAALAESLLPAYLAALFIAELMPFDFVVSRNELLSKISDGRVQFVPFAGSVSLAAIGRFASVAAKYLPLGLLSVLARQPSELRPAPPVRLGVNLLVPGIVEVLKLFVYSRNFDSTDILGGMSGVLAGKWLGCFISSKSLAKWLAAPLLSKLKPVLWLAWLVVVLYFNWRPFNFTTDPVRFSSDPEELPELGLRRASLAPFVDYYWGSKYNALDRFDIKGLSFFPAGALMALSARGIFYRGAQWRVLIVAAVVATIVQVGRYFLPLRTPSMTDILIQCTGAWLGFRLTQFVYAAIWAEVALYDWLRTPNEPLHFITAQPNVLPLPASRQRLG